MLSGKMDKARRMTGMRFRDNGQNIGHKNVTEGKMRWKKQREEKKYTLK